ncbi:MAG: MMPL family transporter [Candidatus Brocadia sp.]|nr:MMPL family transporter [Candidatus Brocadia sp.]UJS20491.1 MAG: MMPL family transporter [Candidatus Brocadia sp.]
MKLEHLLRKVAFVIFLYHKKIVILFSVLIIASFYTIFHMKIESDVLDVLPSGNKTVAQYKDFIEKYGTMDNIVFIVESEDNKISENIDLIEKIAKNLSESPLIEYVDYGPLNYKNEVFIRYLPLFLDETGIKFLKKRLTPQGIKQQVKINHDRLVSPLSSPFDYEMIARDPLNLHTILRASLLKQYQASKLDLSMGYYFTKDHSAALLLAKPTGKGRDMAFVKELKKELDIITFSALQECSNPPGVKVGITGGHAIAEDIRQIIKHDVTVSSALSIILIGLLIMLAYRVRIKILSIIGLTMFASLAVTLAFAYLLFGSLNIVTSAVVAILIDIYVDYSLHMVKRYCDEFKKHNNPYMALEVTLTRTGPAIILSALTTSLSFFCILVTNFKGLYELGVVSGIGVILSMMCNLFLMNALLVWISKSGLQRIQYGRNFFRGSGNFPNFLIGKTKYILTLSAILVCLAAFGIARLKFNNNPDSLAPVDSPAILSGKKLGEKMGKKGEPLNIIIKSDNKEELSRAFDELETVSTRWKHAKIIEDYSSLNTFMPKPSDQLINVNTLRKIGHDSLLRVDSLESVLISALEKNGFVFEKDYINKYLHETVTTLNTIEPIGFDELEAMSIPNVSHFYNKRDLSIVAYLYPTVKGWDKRTVDTIQDYIISKGGNWVLVGKPILFTEIQSSIIWNSGIATVLTVLLNLIIIYWYFRRFLVVVLVMLPVTLGFVFTVGIMGYANISFNVFNISAIALIFGLGVDYGIYVIQAYLMEDTVDVGNALRISGKNVIMCAATTIAGCGSLITAKFIGIATIGLVLSIGAITCAFTALIILPAIIMLKGKRLCHARL